MLRFSPDLDHLTPRRTGVLVWTIRLLIVAFGPCALWAPMAAGPLLATAAAAMLLAFMQPGVRLPWPGLSGLFAIAAVADLALWAGVTAFWAEAPDRTLTDWLELLALHTAGATVLFSAYGGGILTRPEWPRICAFGGIAALTALLAAPYAGLVQNALWLILFFWIAVVGLIRWSGPLATAAFAVAAAALLWRAAGAPALASIAFGGFVGALAGRSARAAAVTLVAPLAAVGAIAVASLIDGAPVAALGVLIDAARFMDLIDTIARRPLTGQGFGALASGDAEPAPVSLVARLWLEVGAVGIGFLLLFAIAVSSRLSGLGAGRRLFDSGFAAAGGWAAAAILIPGADWFVWTALSWVLALAAQAVPGSLARPAPVEESAAGGDDACK